MNNQKVVMNDTEDEIDLLELWYLFLDKLKFIILFAVIGCLIAGSFTYFLIAPKYQATARLYIVSASNDSLVNLTDLQIGTNLTSDYKVLVLARPVLESVIKNLGLEDTTPDDLKKMININNPSSTRILEITATTTDPKLSKDIANEMAKVSRIWLPEVMETATPNIAEDAVTPERKSSPSLKKNALIGGVALAALYFGICVVVYLMNDTVRSAEEFEKYFGIVPLASVPEDDSVDYGDSDSKRKKSRGRKGR